MTWLFFLKNSDFFFPELYPFKNFSILTLQARYLNIYKGQAVLGQEVGGIVFHKQQL